MNQTTTDTTVRNMAGEPTDPSRDLVAVAVRGLVGGLLVGTGGAALALWVVRLILAGAPASDRPVATGPAFYVLTLGTMAAMVLAGTMAFRWLEAIDSPFRRGTLAMVAGMGTFVGSLIVTVLYHVLGEIAGLGIHALLGLAVLGLGTGFALGARRPRYGRPT